MIRTLVRCIVYISTDLGLKQAPCVRTLHSVWALTASVCVPVCINCVRTGYILYIFYIHYIFYILYIHYIHYILHIYIFNIIFILHMI